MSLQSRIDAFLESYNPPPPPPGIPFPSYFSTLMNWRFPLSVALGYVFFVIALNPKSSAVSRVVAKSKGLNEKSTSKKSGKPMTAFVFFHNALLCVYSAITFYSSLSALVKRHRTANSWSEAICDDGKVCWNEALGYWAYLFYLSKYYEIIDTIIIIAKGRRSSFLQTYHHAGAIITMWIATKSATPAIWIFVVFNSFIHTIMYFYYALTTIGISPPGKQYLTTAQILQFAIGSLISFVYFGISGCMDAGAKFSAVVTLAYIGPLLYLFFDFALRTYGKGTRVTKAKHVNGNGIANGRSNGVKKSS